MPESLELSDFSLPASVMLAEHQRVSNLYLHNAAMGERRVSIIYCSSREVALSS